MKKFSLKTIVYCGVGSLDYLQRFTNKKIWIVCDNFLATGPLYQHLLTKLNKNNQIYLFSDVTADPDISLIAKGIESLRKIQPQIIIGFGGGSAIDAAKAIRFFVAKEQKLSLESCIAIPTTSGTGSEVTSATVITDQQKGIKYPLFDPSIFPDIAILDPELTVSLPANITASTGLDVLTHALESYVSIDANDFSDTLAEKAAQTIFKYLPTAYADGQCLVTRSKIHNASSMAGMAFSQAGLGLNHAIAHQLGGQFHIPHGVANAILLPPVIRANAHDPRALRRYARITKHCHLCSQSLTDKSAVNQLIFHIKQLLNKVKIASSLTKMGFSPSKVRPHINEIIKAARSDSTIMTNPGTVSDNDIKKIIEAIL